MVLSSQNYLEWSLQYRKKDLVIKGQSKSFIKFCIRPSSFHQKAWISKVADDDQDNVIIQLLCMEKELIRSENFIQIEMDMLSTTSSSILSHVLTDVPGISQNVRDGLASDLIVAVRKFINKKVTTLVDKSLVVHIKTMVFTDIFLDSNVKEDQNLIKEYESGIYKQIQNNHNSIQEECAICLQEYSLSKEEPICCMLCSHIFHIRCLSSWLAGKSNCPICRFKLPGPSLVFQELAEKVLGQNG